MPKLWIVHRNAQDRTALLRLSGLPEADVVEGAPSDPAFAAAPAPRALILGVADDLELELDFVHRHRQRLADARCLLVTSLRDAAEVQRLFGPLGHELATGPPNARTIRSFIAAAGARREAASLAQRQHRARISERFSSWLGGVEVPGLLRALDPALAGLPLLVRGVPGSGRTLVCHYVEIFRGGRGRCLRIHARDLGATADGLARRLSEAGEGDAPAPASVWVDEIDSLSITAQAALAETVTQGSGEVNWDTTNLRWIATAGPSRLDDPLETSLEHAFAPLVIEIPSLLDHPETVASIARDVANDWTRTVGGVPREFGDSALVLLEGHPWSGDRAELEAVLRTTLASSSREVLEDVDLRFPSDPSDVRPVGADGITSLLAADDEVRGPEDAQGAEAEQRADERDGEIADWPSPQPGIEDVGDIAEFGEIPEAVFADDPRPKRRVVEPLAAADPVEAPTEPDDAPTIDEGGEGGEGNSDESARLAEASFALSEDPSFSAQPDGTPDPDGGLGWRRLARSLSHEIRNPLVSIRTFAELLPEHFDDETFRARFTELVGRDVSHISDVLTRLSSIAEQEKFEAEPVDVSALIEALLEERRERIAQGRLLVLRELEREAPLAWADARGLEIALAGLLDRALESLPERGDLFVATRHLERGADGEAKLRILLRHHNPTAGGPSDGGLGELDPRANILEYVLAETVVASTGGTLTIDANDAQETLILIDLETPI